MRRIAILASGSGTNAENIIKYFEHSNIARVTLIVTDNPDAFVLQRALRLGVKTAIISREQLGSTNSALELLRSENIDYIVLAGFLSLIPPSLIKAFEGCIINIHPALLPAYGGKGMYGERVHRAVVAAGEHESGITIHAVNERYDQGAVIAQYRVALREGETAESLAEAIHELEQRHFPQVIEEQIKKMKTK